MNLRTYLMTRTIGLGIRLVTPIVVAFVVYSLKCSLMAAVTWVSGVRAAALNLADSYLETAAQSGIPSDYDIVLRPIFIGVVVFELLLGWVVLSHFTVFLFWLIF